MCVYLKYRFPLSVCIEDGASPGDDLRGTNKGNNSSVAGVQIECTGPTHCDSHTHPHTPTRTHTHTHIHTTTLAYTSYNRMSPLGGERQEIAVQIAKKIAFSEVNTI